MTQETGPRWTDRISIPVILLGALFLLFLVLAGYHHWPLFLPFASLSRALYRYAVGVYALLPLFLLGHVIATHLHGPVPDGVWTPYLAFLYGSTAIVLLGLVLLFTGTYRSLWWPLLALAGNLAALLILVRRKWHPLEAYRGLFSLGTDPQPHAPFHRLLRGSVALILFLAGFHALLPPDARDERVYHLVLPRLWETQHNAWIPLDNLHWAFPANTEILWAYARSVGSLHTPRILTWAFGLLTILLLDRWLRQLGYATWSRSFSLLFLVATPMCAVMLGICYVEWPMAFFLVLGWVLLHPGPLQSNARWWLPAALAWGMATGMKYTALPVVGLLVVDHLRLQRKVTHQIRFLGTLLLVSVVFLGPWLYRNLRTVGDPFYPLGATLLYRESTMTPAHPDTRGLMHYGRVAGAWRLFPWLYHATADRTVDHRLHVGWLLLFPAIVGLGLRVWPQGPWLTVVLGLGTLFWLQPSPRIYFPLMVLALPYLAALLDRIGQRSRRGLAWLMIVILWMSLPWTYYFWFMTHRYAAQEYLLGTLTERGYLERAGFLTPVIRRIRSETSADARIWVWCEESALYLDRWALTSSYLDPPTFLRALRNGGTAGLDRQIARRGLTHILIRHENCPLPIRTVRMRARNWQVPEALVPVLDRWLRVTSEFLVRDSRYTLFRIRQRAPGQALTGTGP